MRIRTVLAVAATLASGAAFAQTPVQITGKYISLGYCQMNSLVSAVGFSGGGCSGVPTGAIIAELCSEGVALRYRDDGSAPTSGVGMPINTNTCFQYNGPLSSFQVIQTGLSGILDVTFYK